MRGAQEGEVDAEDPFGDVREGQVADVLGVLGQVHVAVQAHGLEHDVAVGQPDPLGVAGRARGVDDGQRVLGAGLLPGLLEGVGAVQPGAARVQGGVGVVGASVRGLDDDEPLQGDGAVGEQGFPAGEFAGALDDGDPRPAVAGYVGDLFGRGGPVHGDGDRAEVDERQVGEPVLGAVAHHEQDVFAAPDAQGGVAGGEDGDLAADLAPVEGLPTGALAPREGGQVAVLGRVAGQQGGEGEFLGSSGQSQVRGHGQLLAVSHRWCDSNTVEPRYRKGCAERAVPKAGCA